MKITSFQPTRAPHSHSTRFSGNLSSVLLKQNADMLQIRFGAGLSELEQTFLNAADSGDAKTVLKCLNAGVNVNTQDITADRLMPTAALIKAAAKGHLSVIKVLLAEKKNENPDVQKKTAPLNLDIQTRSGSTALIYAITHDQTEIAALLIEAGANPNLGEPLWYAALRNDVKTTKALIEAGADVMPYRFSKLSINPRFNADNEATQLVLDAQTTTQKLKHGADNASELIYVAGVVAKDIVSSWASSLKARLKEKWNGTKKPDDQKK